MVDWSERVFAVQRQKKWHIKYYQTTLLLVKPNLVTVFLQPNLLLSTTKLEQTVEIEITMKEV